MSSGSDSARTALIAVDPPGRPHRFSSIDFGANRPATAQFADPHGLRTPQPTSMIQLPKSIMDDESVLLEARRAKGALGWRAQAMSHSATTFWDAACEGTARGLQAIGAVIERALGLRKTPRRAPPSRRDTKKPRQRAAPIIKLEPTKPPRTVHDPQIALKIAERCGNTLDAPEPIKIEIVRPPPLPKKHKRKHVARIKLDAIAVKAPAIEVDDSLDTGRIYLLDKGAALRTRASEDSRRAAIVLPGEKITVFPGHSAPEGWVLAQKQEGEIGFLKKSALL